MKSAVSATGELEKQFAGFFLRSLDMTIGDVCYRDAIYTFERSSIVDAARLMRLHHIGSVVVVEETMGERYQPIGMLTDRDIVVELVAKNRNPREVTVRDLMTRPAVVARENDDLLMSIQVMREHGIRRLPVVDRQNYLIGIVSMDDLLGLLANELSELTRVTLVSRSTEARLR
jgi:CBS domain-containing protein